MRLLLRDTVEPCLLVLEIEVAREMDIVSFMVVVVLVDESTSLSDFDFGPFQYRTRGNFRLFLRGHPIVNVKMNSQVQNLVISLGVMQRR